MQASRNEYDWLGHGAYFWENSPHRALQWAKEKAKRSKVNGKSFKPAVIGAIIDPGHCLNLMDSESIEMVSNAYKSLCAIMMRLDAKIPTNTSLQGSKDLLLRNLDCAVIQPLH